MNEEEKLDLSALDPLRQPDRWQHVMDETMLRVDGVLAARRTDALSAIAAWRRPLLVAAGILVALLVPVEIALEKREHDSESIERLTSLSATWTPGDTPPSSAAFLRALTSGQEP